MRNYTVTQDLKFSKKLKKIYLKMDYFVQARMERFYSVFENYIKN